MIKKIEDSVYVGTGVLSTASDKIYFSEVGSVNKWDGLPCGIWCGTPPIARFVARWLNRIQGWWFNVDNQG